MELKAPANEPISLHSSVGECCALVGVLSSLPVLFLAGLVTAVPRELLLGASTMSCREPGLLLGLDILFDCGLPWLLAGLVEAWLLGLLLSLTGGVAWLLDSVSTAGEG